MAYSQDEIKSLMEQLRDPFKPQDVKWRVTNKSKDGKKGMVAPYADPRAYNARLNDVLGYGGWDCKLTTSTTMGLTRKRGQELVSTGKVTVVATLYIHGIGENSSTGEMWADDDNAVTRAEAQAKKRACAMFGLGEYFYAFKELGGELWVPIDNYGAPTKYPQLPKWALPGASITKKALPVVALLPKSQQVAVQSQPVVHQPVAVQKPRQPHLVEEVERDKDWFDNQYVSRQKELGDSLCSDIYSIVREKMELGILKGNIYSILIEKMDSAVTILNNVRAYAADAEQGWVDALLNNYKTVDFSTVPNYTALYLIALGCGVVPAIAKRAA